MINKKILIFITLCSLCFVGCGSNKTEKQSISKEANETILYINEKTIPCRDGGEIQDKRCFQTRGDPSEEWLISYDTIESFNYEEGYRYKIKVNILTPKYDEPIADAPDRIYTLIKILEKTLIENGVEYEL